VLTLDTKDAIMHLGIFSTPYSMNYPAGLSAAQDVIDWDLLVTEWADHYGLHEAYFAEHYTIGHEPSPAPDLMIAAASQRTDTIKLGAAAHLLPYHNPIALAHRLLWLDHMTGGRYIAGFAPGSFPTDAQLFGTGNDNPKMLADALEIIDAIWTREPPFRVETEHWTADMPAYTEMWNGPHLKPLQQPRPEVIMTGMQPASPTLAQAGKHGFAPMSQQVSARVLRQQWETYAEAAEAAGYTADRSRWRVIRDVFVADTDAEARRLVVEGAAGRTWEAHVLPAFKAVRARGSQKPYALGELMLDEGMEIDELTVEWMAEHYWLVGSPETVAHKIDALNDELGGIGAIITMTFDYSDDREAYRRNLELLGTEVGPRIASDGAMEVPASSPAV
jgi:alkanesulfonate monooxygenase SsuD/methylene tetrahydromethanopterin reductase-like flavin-dependent oxidoreductase (luciferase family)